MRYPSGEYLMQVIASVCPIHCNGGAGHDNNFPFRILMDFVNRVLKMVDKGDCEGRKGPIDI